MSPTLRRLVITLAVVGLAAGIVLVTIYGSKRPAPPPSPPPAAAGAQDAGAPPSAPETPAETPAPEAGPETPPPVELTGLYAAWVEVDHAPASLGSLDPRVARLHLELSAAGAGLARITLPAFWQTAAQSHRAAAHWEALDRGDPDPPPLPDESQRYVLQTAQPLRWFDVEAGAQRERLIPLLATHSVEINGQRVPLVAEYTDDGGRRWTQWKETAPGRFEATVVDADKSAVARITREFVLAEDYDVVVRQRLVNLAEGPLDVAWIQYGPGDLIVDRSRYMDRRRFRAAYLPDPASLPELIVSRDNDTIFERSTVIKNAKKAEKTTDPLRQAELLTIWPDPASPQWDLAWFAATNRYFALATHPLPETPAGPVRLSLEPTVAEIRAEVSGRDKSSQAVFTTMYSRPRRVAPGEEASFDMGVYMGPLDRSILGDEQPMADLQMKGLILYQMSSFCALCTFQWLAILLLQFLSAVHFAVADWGVAIILLVVVVRVLLHPLTKRSQVNMQRFSKAMTDLKPEIEKLQKKYPTDAKKVQQEQMRLMRERGVNPFQMLGCLPMFLQMPIWVALYAMLYFALELRHEPAFWGIFQTIAGWPFLADLSAADHCIWEFAEPFKFFIWNVTGINVLPVLLGVVFFIQQKYMAPPPSPSMTKEQIQQQKIMKVMMVVLFPVMLYSAPSGLTLYICTSSFLGIIESRYVRAHIKAMDLAPPKPPPGKKRKPKDLQGRLYASALERAKQKRKPPPKKYKRRK